MNKAIRVKAAAKVKAAGLKTTQIARSQAVKAAADTLERLRDDAAAANQFNAAVQAERIRAQIFGAEAETPSGLDLTALDDAALIARLDAALAEIKRAAPRDTAQPPPVAGVTPDIFK